MVSRFRTRAGGLSDLALWKRHARALRALLDAQNRRLWEAARARDVLAHAVMVAARSEPEVARIVPYEGRR